VWNIYSRIIVQAVRPMIVYSISYMKSYLGLEDDSVEECVDFQRCMGFCLHSDPPTLILCLISRSGSSCSDKGLFTFDFLWHHSK
jgi:hypothetical protein